MVISAVRWFTTAIRWFLLQSDGSCCNQMVPVAIGWFEHSTPFHMVQEPYFYPTPVIEEESEMWRVIRECHEGTGNSVEANASEWLPGIKMPRRHLYLTACLSRCNVSTIESSGSCHSCQHGSNSSKLNHTEILVIHS